MKRILMFVVILLLMVNCKNDKSKNSTTNDQVAVNDSTKKSNALENLTLTTGKINGKSFALSYNNTEDKLKLTIENDSIQVERLDATVFTPLKNVYNNGKVEQILYNNSILLLNETNHKTLNYLWIQNNRTLMIPISGDVGKLRILVFNFDNNLKPKDYYIFPDNKANGFDNIAFNPLNNKIITATSGFGREPGSTFIDTYIFTNDNSFSEKHSCKSNVSIDEDFYKKNEDKRNVYDLMFIDQIKRCSISK